MGSNFQEGKTICYRFSSIMSVLWQIWNIFLLFFLKKYSKSYKAVETVIYAFNEHKRSFDSMGSNFQEGKTICYWFSSIMSVLWQIWNISCYISKKTNQRIIKQSKQ